MIKAVFVDRDGTLNVEKGHVFKIEDFELLPGTIEALKLLTQRDIKIFVITNQAGIAKGYYNEEQFKEITQHITGIFQAEDIAIEKTLYCPHHPHGVVLEYTKSCECRKPGTLLIESVMAENHYKHNELVLIGDKNTDIDAGFKLGLRTYLVLTGYGHEHKEKTNATYVTPDLLSAVRHLLKMEDGDRPLMSVEEGHG
ncbi:MAG: HAD family hydrolase [Syntrophaceae bacterium]|jgi:D-glycero-D-manno-heptose 1,7-bisphosphate phosphatase